MGTAATHLTIIKHQNSNIGGGILTFYLVGPHGCSPQGRGDQPVGLGCAGHSVDDRSAHLDEWNQRAAQREDFAGRGSGGDDVFLWVHLSSGCRRGRSHTLARRRFWRCKRHPSTVRSGSAGVQREADPEASQLSDAVRANSAGCAAKKKAPDNGWCRRVPNAQPFQTELPSLRLLCPAK